MKILLTILFLISIAQAQTKYYVANDGDNSNNGTSQSTPWQTVAKVNASTFSPGDSILFKKGGVWREYLQMPSSGTYGSHIVVSSYGTGEQPKISAEDIYSTWTSEKIGGTNFIATNAPLSYWYFEDAASPSLDASSNHNNFVWGGAAARSSTNHQGTYSFSQGSTPSSSSSVAYASLSSNFPGKGTTTDFTIGFWVKLKTSWSIYSNIIGLSDNSAKGWYFATSFTNKIRFRVYGNIDRTIDSDNTYLDGGWHHIIARWRGSTDDELSMWIDGVKQSSTFTMASVDLVTASNLSMQRGDVDNIDELFVFPTALSDGDLKSVYAHELTGAKDSITVYYSSAPASNPYTVIDNGSLLNNVGAKLSIVAGSWWYDSTNARAYVGSDPTGHTMEIGARSGAILTNAKNYLTFDGLDLEGGNSKSGTFRITSSHHITLKNSYLHNGYTAVNDGSGGDTIIIGPGNHMNRGYGYGFVSFNLTTAKGANINGNHIEDYGNLLADQIIGTDNACGIFADMYEVMIENNYIHNIAIDYYVLKQGIYVSHTKATIRYNYVRDCGHSAAKISSHSDSAKIYNNVFYHCSLGVNVVGSAEVQVYNNTITGADNLNRSGFNGYAVSVWPDINNPSFTSSITLLKNNIIHDNYWTNAPIRQIYVVNDPTCSLSGSDYNIIWSDILNSGVQIEYKDVGYTIAQWQALGQDAHSLNVDPLMVNKTSDWHLLETSPAINAGTNVGLLYTGSGPDIGAYELGTQPVVLNTNGKIIYAVQ